MGNSNGIMESDPVLEMKIVLLGDSGVGKTCLINRFSRDTFDSSSSTVIGSTASFTVASPSGQYLPIQIWDTAGQEKYRSITQMYFRDTDVAIVCISPKGLDTDEFTISEARQKSCESANTWIQEIRNSAGESCRIVLATTKMDLMSREEQDGWIECSDGLVPEVGAERHYSTSSLTGYGVREMFCDVAGFGRVVRCSSRVVQNHPTPDQGAKSSCC
jgi:small GTP-binding protein